MFQIEAVQAALKEFGIDGWLLYDFRGLNILAQRILEMDPNHIGSRRCFYYVPQNGTPQKLVHRIESGALDHLPGDKTIYLRWQELEEGLKNIVSGCPKLAMEYSPNNGNPYVSRVDGGMIELVRSMGPEIVSSGNLVQSFEAVWTDEQLEMHYEADRLNQAAFEMVWALIADSIRAGKTLRETDVQQAIMDYFAANNQTTYSPPIIGVNSHSGDPHYSPEVGNDSEINEGDFILVDLWSKMIKPNSVYSDLTKTGFVGTEIPERHNEIFQIVAAARDAGIACVRDRFAAGKDVFGWEVDDATRKVIEDAGYGEYYIHRTGHNIGQETHGNGCHIDNLETHEDRQIIKKTCFSIEPGIYLPEFGVRSEVDVYVSEAGEVIVTGGLQTEVKAIMA